MGEDSLQITPASSKVGCFRVSIGISLPRPGSSLDESCLVLALQHPTGPSHNCFCVGRCWRAVSESIITKASNKEKKKTQQMKFSNQSCSSERQSLCQYFIRGFMGLLERSDRKTTSKQHGERGSKQIVSSSQHQPDGHGWKNTRRDV